MKERMALDYRGTPVRLNVIEKLNGKKTDTIFQKVCQCIEENKQNTEFYA